MMTYEDLLLVRTYNTKLFGYVNQRRPPNSCECPANRECVYQENRSDMRAYVFYCRNTADMAQGDVYRFPEAT